MTELERMLKNTLIALEQDLTATQKTHGTSLVNHQRSLESHAQAIRQLQEKVGQLQTEDNVRYFSHIEKIEVARQVG